MSVIATLTYSENLQVIFDIYSEKYEGTYPNLKYKASIRFKYTGNFRINTNNTVTLGNLQTTISRSDTSDVTDSDWYYLGEIVENMGCSRQRKLTYDCSNIGYPNVSGQASITTPLIDLPTYNASVTDIDKTSVTVHGEITNNPYGLYTLRLYDGNTYVLNSLNGDFTFTNLNASTQYTYYAQVFLVDCSGQSLNQKILSATTLENYQELKIKSVSTSITKGSTTDNVTFTVHTSNDSNIKSTSWSSDGSTWTSVNDKSFTITGLDKNYEGTYYVKVIDTLSRESSVFTFNYHTTYTNVEAWVFDGTNWKRGQSLRLNNTKSGFKACRLYVFNGSKWKPAIEYK